MLIWPTTSKEDYFLYLTHASLPLRKISLRTHSKRNMLAEGNDLSVLIHYDHFQIHPPVLNNFALHSDKEPLDPFFWKRFLDV